MNVRRNLLCLMMFVGCIDEAAIDDAGGVGDAAIDGGLLGCMEADVAYFTAIARDPRLQELGACVRDEDCVIWRPDLACPATGLHAFSCGAGTRADQVDASYARRDEIASSICAHIEPTCRIGVSCPPRVVARCNLGACAARPPSEERTDGGVDGG